MASRATPSLRSSSSGRPVTTPPPGLVNGACGGAKATDRRLRRWIADIAIAHRSLRAGLDCQSGFGVLTVSVSNVLPCGGRPTRVQVAAVPGQQVEPAGRPRNVRGRAEQPQRPVGAGTLILPVLLWTSLQRW